MSEYSKKVRSALDAAVTAIGGSPRDGQIEMAEAVANALSDRHHLLVQAGTGTGAVIAADFSSAVYSPLSRARARSAAE